MTAPALLAELEGATRALLEAAGDGSLAALEATLARREALVRALGATPVAARDHAETVARLRRLLDLDREVQARLETQRAAVAAQLAGLGRARRALVAYRAPEDPAGLDRVG